MSEKKPPGWREAVGGAVTGSTVAAVTYGGMAAHNMLEPVKGIYKEIRATNQAAGDEIRAMSSAAKAQISNVYDNIQQFARPNVNAITEQMELVYDSGNAELASQLQEQAIKAAKAASDIGRHAVDAASQASDAASHNLSEGIKAVQERAKDLNAPRFDKIKELMSEESMLKRAPLSTNQKLALVGLAVAATAVAGLSIHAWRNRNAGKEQAPQTAIDAQSAELQGRIVQQQTRTLSPAMA